MNRIIDPNRNRALPRWQRALKWRLPLEFGQFVSKLGFRPFEKCVDISSIPFFVPERAEERGGSAVTAGQFRVLIAALEESESLSDPIVEVGAWTGATTVELAKHTGKTVYAVDPHFTDDFPGINDAYAEFQDRISAHPSIIHLRQTSGEACERLLQQNQSLSFVFIDAIHDYINAYFDFRAWERLVVPGGMIVFHDVDDHIGTNRACRKVLSDARFEVWGYAPNIVAFKKKVS